MSLPSRLSAGRWRSYARLNVLRASAAAATTRTLGVAAPAEDPTRPQIRTTAATV